jgi:hypothetical protein
MMSHKSKNQRRKTKWWRKAIVRSYSELRTTIKVTREIRLYRVIAHYTPRCAAAVW